MKQLFIKKTLLASLMLGIISISSAQATTVTLLDENFDDTTNTTIQSLLSSNPSSLPTGTTWSSTGNASAVNLRLGSDTINTYNAGNPFQRFGSSSNPNYFLPATAANKFLIMGDDSGQLAGSPTAGTFGFATPFSLASGTTDITVSFDWVFSVFPLNTTIADTDQFKVGITGNGFSITSPLTSVASILNQSITATSATGGNKLYGPTSINIAVANLGQADANGQYWLSFGYLEANASNNNNGAVGIDNIKITANVAPVPLPAAAWPFLSGFMGLAALSKRKRLVV